MKRRTQPKDLAKVTSIGSRLEPILHAQIGWVTGITPEGSPLVDFPGNPAGALPAKMVAAAQTENLAEAARSRREVALLFDRGDPLRPILLGILAIPTSNRTESEKVEAAPPLPEFVEVDGKRVCIEGKDEIVLRCGEACITLRRNGKIIIRGAYLESHSSGTNRMKGAVISFN